MRRRQLSDLLTVAPEFAALANSGLVKAADYRDQERHKSLKQGEIAVTISTDRANLVLELFEAYYKRVYCFSRKSLAPSAAEDIAQPRTAPARVGLKRARLNRRPAAPHQNAAAAGNVSKDGILDQIFPILIQSLAKGADYLFKNPSFWVTLPS